MVQAILMLLVNLVIVAIGFVEWIAGYRTIWSPIMILTGISSVVCAIYLIHCEMSRTKKHIRQDKQV